MTTTETPQLTLAAQARAYIALCEEYTAASRHKDELKAEKVEAEQRLMERMDAEEVPSITTGGKKFVKTGTRYGNVQDREAFVQWAKENDESLIKIIERKGELSELVRERLDNDEPLPPGVGWHITPFISQTAA